MKGPRKAVRFRLSSANLVLDDLYKELDAGVDTAFAGTQTTATSMFASRRAGERVMASVTRFLTQKLKLKVNEAKSVAGQAGSGKSWLLRAIIASLLHFHGPAAIRYADGSQARNLQYTRISIGDRRPSRRSSTLRNRGCITLYREAH